MLGREKAIAKSWLDEHAGEAEFEEDGETSVCENKPTYACELKGSERKRYC